MALDAAQVRDMITLGVREAVSHLFQAGAPGVQQGDSHRGAGGWRKRLDWRAFDGMEVYKGGEVEWVDWMWRMKVQIGPMAPVLIELMELAEKNKGLSTSQLVTMVDPVS